MEMPLLDYKYSLFGDFRELNSNIDKIVDRLDGFAKQIVRPNINFGSTSNTYLFRNDKGTLRVSIGRIDFAFSNENANETDFIKNVFDKIADFITPISPFNRLAINYSFFVQDESGDILKSINNKIDIINSNSKIREFIIRQNLILTLDGKDFNNIYTIQNTEMQDMITFKQFKACQFSLDINSCPKPEIAFLKEDFLSFFGKLKSVAFEQKNKITEIAGFKKSEGDFVSHE